MKKVLLFTFIFLAVLSSAWAFTGNTSNHTVQGDFVEGSGKGNTSETEVYWVITQQPVQINGYFDGKYGYVGFFPMSDNYTYYIPFSNGTMQFHCNPDLVELGKSIICTASVLDEDGNAVNNARINWELFNYSDTSFDYGEFEFVNNGVYKFRIDVPLNATTGDYYLVFDAVGFKTDYSFPIFITRGFSNIGIALALGLIVLAYAILTVKLSGRVPHLQTMFLVFSEVMALISLRVFNEMTGYTQFLSGYKVMLWVIVLTVIFLFVELFINIVLPIIRKRFRR